MTKIYHSDDIKQLSIAMIEVHSKLKPAIKDSDNPFFKSKYADLVSVMEASRELLAENKLFVIHIPDINEFGTQILMPMLIHESGQWIRGYYKLNPIKDDPSSLAAASTMGRRASYNAITGVVAADEDDDGNESSGNVKSQQATSPTAGKSPMSPATPLPHPNTVHPIPLPTPAISNSKSAFITKELRDKWFADVNTAIANALSLDDLEKVKSMYKARITQIQSVNHAGDVVLLKRLMESFDIRWEMLIPKAPVSKQPNVDSAMRSVKKSEAPAFIADMIDDEIPF